LINTDINFQELRSEIRKHTESTQLDMNQLSADQMSESTSRFESLTSSLVSFFQSLRSELESHAGNLQVNIKQLSADQMFESRSRFESLTSSLVSSFQSLRSELESRDENLQVNIKQLSADQTFESRSRFESLTSSLVSFFQSLRSDLESRDENLQVNFKQLSADQMSESRSRFESLTSSLVSSFQSLQSVVESHAGNLQVNFKQLSADQTFESRSQFETLTGKLEFCFQVLRSELESRVEILQDNINQSSSDQISQSVKALRFLSGITRREIGAMAAKLTPYLTDLRDRAMQLAQALDLNVASAASLSRHRRLSMVEERRMSVERLPTCNTIEHGHSIPQMSEDALNTDASADGSRRISTQDSVPTVNRRMSGQATITLRNTGLRARSKVLDRLSEQLAHLYREATIEDYEKLKPVVEEGAQQIMCNVGRFEVDSRWSWINYVFGTGPADAVTGKEQSRLIHPCSPFITGLLI
jgi:hypothetical protein